MAPTTPLRAVVLIWVTQLETRACKTELEQEQSSEGARAQGPWNPIPWLRLMKCAKGRQGGSFQFLSTEPSAEGPAALCRRP